MAADYFARFKLRTSSSSGQVQAQDKFKLGRHWHSCMHITHTYTHTRTRTTIATTIALPPTLLPAYPIYYLPCAAFPNPPTLLPQQIHSTSAFPCMHECNAAITAIVTAILLTPLLLSFKLPNTFETTEYTGAGFVAPSIRHCRDDRTAQGGVDKPDR